jgi:hypothetical protein
LGGGINVWAYEGNGAEVSLTILNTILHGNKLPGDVAQDLSFGQEDPGQVIIGAYSSNIGDVLIDDDEGTPIDIGDDLIDADPAFVDASNGDYHLTSISPCIDSGRLIQPPPSLPETDIEGNLRIVGDLPDMGAYEYTGAPSTEPIIGYSPGILNFTAIEGGPNPVNQTLDIWNSGAGTLDWSLFVPVWLSPSSWSGSSTGEIDTIIASVDISGMAAGDYDSTIIISSPLASNSPQIVDVNLTINPAAGPGITWNCPLGGVTLIAPYPIQGRPYFTDPVDPAQITVSAGASLWGIYYLDEATGEWLYFIPGFAGSTLTKLQPYRFYLVVVSGPCILS